MEKTSNCPTVTEFRDLLTNFIENNPEHANTGISFNLIRMEPYRRDIWARPMKHDLGDMIEFDGCDVVVRTANWKDQETLDEGEYYPNG